MTQTYGLLGRTLSHSFSPRYFADKFAREGISDAQYHAFELAEVSDLPALLARTPTLRGLNVTIPYKEQVIPYLDRLSPAARAIGAVNTIAFEGDALVGHNTDVVGFRQSLLTLLPAERAGLQALVLGTGGAAKAVAYVLEQLELPYRLVSRTREKADLVYQEVTAAVLEEHLLLINTTPLGTYPDVEAHPDLPYSALSAKHLLFDLIYNPAETVFLQRGRVRGAKTLNGLPMLEAQAEAAWDIWNRS